MGVQHGADAGASVRVVARTSGLRRAAGADSSSLLMLALRRSVSRSAPPRPSPPVPAPSSTPASSPAPTAPRLRPRLDALGHPAARRVRHRPRQERHACRAGSRARPPPPSPASRPPSVMTSDGAEYRFWVYADTANENRYVSDTGSVFELRLEHHRPGRSSTPSAPPPATPPTPTPPSAPTRPAGPSTASCSTSRADTYTLSKRAAAADAWTPLKAPRRSDLRHPDA